MQKTDFPFEVIVSDDMSTDGTREIISLYAKEYSDIIKPVFHKKNLGSLNNYRDNFLRATGKYIAICEGDDYWTDPDKLQKQVDFMENNPDHTICFHPVVIKYEDSKIKDQVFPEDKTDFTLDKLLDGNFIQTNSVMYRRQKKYELSKTDFVPGDWYVHVYHARLGKIGFINQPMAVYRKHDGVMWANNNNAEFWKKYALRHLEFCRQLALLFPADKARRDKVMLFSARLLYEINKAVDARSDLFKAICREYPELIAEYVSFLKQIIIEKDAALDSVNANVYGDMKTVVRKVVRKIKTRRR
jgi:glycosyltransferase involved in cell wall biosynthesis